MHNREYFSEATERSYIQVILQRERNLFFASAYSICIFFLQTSRFFHTLIIYSTQYARVKGYIGISRPWQGDWAKILPQ